MEMVLVIKAFILFLFWSSGVMILSLLIALNQISIFFQRFQILLHEPEVVADLDWYASNLRNSNIDGVEATLLFIRNCHSLNTVIRVASLPFFLIK
jgi:hypothetical protein